MIACLRKKEESEESWGMKNGRRLLEESISLFDGKVNAIRCFSAREIEIATNYFHPSQRFRDDGLYELYRCSLRDQEVLVKRCSYGGLEDNLIRDIVVASRMSVHKNTLKLIGCCLETKTVALVYESFDCAGSSLGEELFRFESDPRPALPWKHRLKIAVDLSNLVAYLHTALPRPLIHRYIKPSNILLDKENAVVKLFDFSLCLSLPEGKSFVEDEPIMGAMGYADPEYVETGRLNEKADVYAFGIMLLILLSGLRSHTRFKSLLFDARCCVDDERFEDMLDPVLSTDEPWPGKDGQLKAFLMLALECTRDRGFDRPDMTEVGTRLIGMYRSAFSDS